MLLGTRRATVVLLAFIASSVEIQDTLSLLEEWSARMFSVGDEIAVRLTATNVKDKDCCPCSHNACGVPPPDSKMECLYSNQTGLPDCGVPSCGHTRVRSLYPFDTDP